MQFSLEFHAKRGGKQNHCLNEGHGSNSCRRKVIFIYGSISFFFCPGIIIRKWLSVLLANSIQPGQIRKLVSHPVISPFGFTAEA